MLVTPPKKKVRDDAFDVKLMPQMSQGDDMPREALPDPEENYVRQYYNDLREVAESRRIIDEY